MSDHNPNPKADSHAIGHVDDWHRHLPMEGLPQREHGSKVNPVALAIVGVVTTLGLIVTVIAVVIYYTNSITKARAARVETSATAEASYTDYMNAQQARTGYGVSKSETQDAVRIPLDIAAQRVIEQYQQARETHGEQSR